MAINDFCAQVTERHYHWKLVRDFVDGEHTIKEEGEYYLPRKGGQSDSDYLAYKARAKPGDYTGQTLESMHGSVMRRAPSIEKPEGTILDKILENFDHEGHSVYQHASDVFRDNMQTNFGGLLGDIPKVEGKISVAERETREIYPFCKYYPAESIVKWGYEQHDSYKKLAWVVLKETVEEVNSVTYEIEKKVQYRVPCLIDGVYHVRLYKEFLENPGTPQQKLTIAEVGDPIPFTVHGKTIDYVPFVFTPMVNVKTSDPLDKPMLYGVAELHKHYYMQSADYENGVHFTTIPTLWTTGHDIDAGAKDEHEATMKLGGDVCLNFPEAEAKIGTVQFAGEGLTHSRQAKEETLEQIGITGTRALSPDKAMSETSDAAKIHRTGENARLATYTRNMSECYTIMLRWMAEWEEIEGKVSLSFNVDYDSIAFDPNALNSIANLARESKYPLPLVFEALKKGEYLPNDITLEQYMLLIQLELGKISPKEELELWTKLRNGEKVEIPDVDMSAVQQKVSEVPQKNAEPKDLTDKGESGANRE